VRLLRRALLAPVVHRRLATYNGEAALTGLKAIRRLPHPEHPWDDLLRACTDEHPTKDAWWDERDLVSLLSRVDIPVYLGSDWTNVPMDLPGTFDAWDALTHNPTVRMALLGEHGLPWPWESLHIEALAWFDQWLKGRDTGITDGPPAAKDAGVEGVNRSRKLIGSRPGGLFLRLALTVETRVERESIISSIGFASVRSQGDQSNRTEAVRSTDVEVVVQTCSRNRVDLFKEDASLRQGSSREHDVTPNPTNVSVSTTRVNTGRFCVPVARPARASL
jgi:hypothetical protein